MPIIRRSGDREVRERPVDPAEFTRQMMGVLRTLEQSPGAYDGAIEIQVQDLRRRIAAKMLEVPTGARDTWEWRHLRALDEAVAEALEWWKESFRRTMRDASDRAWDLGSKPSVEVPRRSGGPSMEELGVTIPQIFRSQLAVANSYHADLIKLVADSSRREIMTAVRRGIIGEQFPHKIISDVQRTLAKEPGREGMGDLRYQARRIVRTETMRVFNLSNISHTRWVASEIGTKGGYRMWLHSGQVSGRPSHIAMDGKKVGVNEKFGLDGYQVEGPHDPVLPARHTVHCKCTMILWYDRWGEAPPRPQPRSDAARGESDLHTQRMDELAAERASEGPVFESLLKDVVRFYMIPSVRRYQEHPGHADQKVHGRKGAGPGLVGEKRYPPGTGFEIGREYPSEDAAIQACVDDLQSLGGGRDVRERSYAVRGNVVVSAREGYEGMCALPPVLQDGDVIVHNHPSGAVGLSGGDIEVVVMPREGPRLGGVVSVAPNGGVQELRAAPDISREEGERFFQAYYQTSESLTRDAISQKGRARLMKIAGATTHTEYVSAIESVKAELQRSVLEVTVERITASGDSVAGKLRLRGRASAKSKTVVTKEAVGPPVAIPPLPLGGGVLDGDAWDGWYEQVARIILPESVVEYVEHPGHADQKVHGRRGAGATAGGNPRAQRLFANSPDGQYHWMDGARPRTAANVEEAAAAHFGTTTDPALGGYMLPDGRMLNFSEQGDMRDKDHREITSVIASDAKKNPSDQNSTKVMEAFISRGNVRLMPQGGGIQLNGKLTAAQTTAMSRWMRNRAADGDGMVTADVFETGPDGESAWKASYGPEAPHRVLQALRENGYTEAVGTAGDGFVVQEHPGHADQKVHGRRSASPGAVKAAAGKVARAGADAIAEDVAAGRETGFTLDPMTGESVSSGFSVADSSGTKLRVPNADKLSRGELERTIRDFVENEAGDLGSGEGRKVGAWLNPDDKSLHLDTPRVAKTLGEGKRIGVEKSQIAIYDLAKGEVVTLTKEDYQASGRSDWEALWNGRDVGEALSEDLARKIATAHGRPPTGFRRWLDESRTVASVRVRGGLFTLVSPVGARWKVVARGLTEAQVSEYQEKKCGQSGIPDENVCHIGDGGRRAGGRVPAGRKQFIDSDKAVAVVKTSDGSYAVVTKNPANKSGFQVEDRGLGREEATAFALKLAGGSKSGPTKGPDPEKPADGPELAQTETLAEGTPMPATLKRELLGAVKGWGKETERGAERAFQSQAIGKSAVGDKVDYPEYSNLTVARNKKGEVVAVASVQHPPSDGSGDQVVLVNYLSASPAKGKGVGKQLLAMAAREAARRGVPMELGSTGEKGSAPFYRSVGMKHKGSKTSTVMTMSAEDCAKFALEVLGE